MNPNPEAPAEEPILPPEGVKPAEAIAAIAAAPSPPPPAEPSLKKAALRGAVWTGSGFALSQVIRFVSNIVLAKLLFPEAFGLIATAQVFLMGLHLFSEVGIRNSIIQHHRGDDTDFLNTAWTLQVIRGCLLFSFTLVLAYPAAYWRLKPETDLLWLLPLLGLMCIIEGAYSTNLHTLNRKLMQGWLVAAELTAQIVSVSFTIFMTYLTPSIWPLAVGQLIAGTIILVASHTLLPGISNRFHWDRAAARDMFHFGKWIYISTVCTFLAGQSDKLVVGFQSMALLGVYHFASQLAMIPFNLTSAFTGQIIFPVYARLNQSGKNLRDYFGGIHLVAAGFAALLVAGLIATGHSVIECIYDQRYQGASWMLRLLTVGIWLQILEMLEASILWSLGHSMPSAISNAGKVLTLVVSMPLGYYLGGFPGLIVGFVTGDFVRYLLTVYFLRKEGLHVLRYDLSLSLFIALVSYIAIHTARHLWPAPPRPELLAVFAAAPDGGLPGAVAWPALGVIYKKDWPTLLMRLLIDGVVVTGIWGVLALVCWKRGMFHKPWKPVEV